MGNYGNALCYAIRLYSGVGRLKRVGHLMVECSMTFFS
jgi:hypothetical protein